MPCLKQKIQFIAIAGTDLKKKKKRSISDKIVGIYNQLCKIRLQK